MYKISKALSKNKIIAGISGFFSKNIRKAKTKLSAIVKKETKED